MKIHHFGGDVECGNLETLHQILDMRYGEVGVNEFLLAGEEKYPYMAVMVKGKDAAVMYFPKDEDWMLQAVDRNSKLDKEESSVFYTGNPELEIEICNEFVIPFEEAVEAVIQFFKVQELPACLEWSKQ